MRPDLDLKAIRHPADLLSAEHRTILGVLDALEVELARRGPLRAGFWRRAADFIVGFADHCHHGKEEGLLFPALEALGLPRGGPTDVMRHEHVEGREYTRRLRAAAEAGDPEAVRAAARAYVDLLRQHIEKEDEVLFAMARSFLPAAEAEVLLARCHRFDAEDVGDAEIARLVELARGLHAEAYAAPARQGR